MLGLCAILFACSPEVKFQLTDVTGAEFGKTLELQDHNGQARNLKQFQGQVVVVIFGYTQCPDFCPTTLSQMTQVLKELGSEASKVQVLFVTVDPERDTPSLLKAYVTAWPADPTEKTALTCLIRPSESQDLLARALQIAQRAVQVEQDPANIPWAKFGLGLAKLRNAQYAAADQTLIDVDPKPETADPRRRGIASLFRAITAFRQGKPDAAQELFRQGEADMPPVPTDPKRALLGGQFPDNYDLLWWIAHEEAGAILNTTRTP
jgi:cytochrome oxidase Cu insertion factor (SCO1/SenC/PrrC family)